MHCISERRCLCFASCKSTAREPSPDSAPRDALHAALGTAGARDDVVDALTMDGAATKLESCMRDGGFEKRRDERQAPALVVVSGAQAARAAARTVKESAQTCRSERSSAAPRGVAKAASSARATSPRASRADSAWAFTLLGSGARTVERDGARHRPAQRDAPRDEVPAQAERDVTRGHCHVQVQRELVALTAGMGARVTCNDEESADGRAKVGVDRWATGPAAMSRLLGARVARCARYGPL